VSQTTTTVTLAVKLRRLLADQQISGRELARRVDMAPATCSRVLRGDRDLTVTELAAVAAALGVTSADLLPDAEVSAAAS